MLCNGIQLTTDLIPKKLQRNVVFKIFQTFCGDLVHLALPQIPHMHIQSVDCMTLPTLY